MKIKQLIHQVSLASRSKDWRLSFVPFTIACVYLWFSVFKLEWSFYHLVLFVLAIVTTFGFAAFGYFINEFFDQAEDAEAGKINKLSALKTYQQALLFTFICGLTFLPWLYLPKNETSYYLITLEILCFFAYSLPVIRLKKQAFVAGILDASYAYLVPSLLSYHTFSLIGKVHVQENTFFLFFILLFLIGYRNILIHQVKDVLNDAKSGLKTLPRVLGPARTQAFFQTVFTVELILFVVVSLTFLEFNPFYGIWTFFSLVYLWRNRAAISSILKGSPFVLLKAPRQSLDLFYQLWFPLIHLFLLLFIDWRWLMLLPVHALLLVNRDYLIEFWQNSKEFLWHRSVKPGVSFLVNTSIYFVFRLFGVNLIKENKSAKEFLQAKFGSK